MKEIKKELVIAKEKVDKAVLIADNFRIENNDQLVQVSDMAQEMKKVIDFLTGEKEKLTIPAKQIIEEAGEKYDPLISRAVIAQRVLKDKAKKYMVGKEEEQLEKEKKIAEKVEMGKMKVETAMKKIEEMPKSEKTIFTGKSGMTLRKRKVAVIQSPNQVPKEYWIIDEVRVRKDALEREKKGLPQIPGVIIQEESIIASL
jgi:hypothetical protein